MNRAGDAEIEDKGYSSQDEYGALQLAIQNDSVEKVKHLIERGVDLDNICDPALHLALRRRNIPIAHLLITAGVDFESPDSHGDYPIHIACELGLVEIVHTLCSLGCNLEVPTVEGLYPLHLAARNGHIAVVRCLCLMGCNPMVASLCSGCSADVTALKYGHIAVANLLDRLVRGGANGCGTAHRDSLARKLTPTTRLAPPRIRLRLLGHAATGKTAAVASLTAGKLGKLIGFRSGHGKHSSSSLHNSKSRPSSPTNSSQIEMDVTSRQNSLSFETPPNYHSTSGIHIQNVDLSGVGEMSIWDFSGQECYFPIYHHFLRSCSYSLTVILFSLDDPPSSQVQQVSFWINFLVARQSADLPSSFDYGRLMLIATHVDLTRAVKTQHGEWVSPDAQKTLETVRKAFPHLADVLMSTVIVMDCNVPASYAFKQLKAVLTDLRQEYNQQSIGTWTGLLEGTLTWLTAVQKHYEHLPVISRGSFSELLRNEINILATDEHINELLIQLEAMSEVLCISDLVILNIAWLGNECIGSLLSSDFLLRARVTGVYTQEDFQACFNQCNASGVLTLLEALGVCIKCDFQDEVEYEFPLYNQTETLEGLWDLDDPRYSQSSEFSELPLYGGFRLFTPPSTCCLLKPIFPHIQIALRRSVLENIYTIATIGNNTASMEDDDYNEFDDTDLYQWHFGSKLCLGDLESLITLVQDEVSGLQYIELKVRGPPDAAPAACFFFLDKIEKVVLQAVSSVTPLLLLEKHVLSVEQLRTSAIVYGYSPDIVQMAILDAEATFDVQLYNPRTETQESVVQLLMFGDLNLSPSVQWGCSLKASELPSATKWYLSGLLDPPEKHGRDWCLLAVKLGLSQNIIAELDSTSRCQLQQRNSIGNVATSQPTVIVGGHTRRLIDVAGCSIGALISSLHELDLLDAAQVVLRSAPILKVMDR